MAVSRAAKAAEAAWAARAATAASAGAALAEKNVYFKYSKKLLELLRECK
jgi:hypothetical protein